MKVTKRQKILLGVLGIAAIFLVIDSMKSPSTAPGDESVAIVQSASDTPSRPLSPNIATSGMSVAYRLEMLRPHKTEINDAFGNVALGAGLPKTSKDADEFQRTHHLTGIFMSGNRSMAMIDGTAIAVGQAIDGFTLESVTKKVAVLRSTDNVVELPLP